jgi:hypothetical protein
MRKVGVLFMSSAIALGLSMRQAAAQDRGDGGGGFWERMSGPGPWYFVGGSINPCLVGVKANEGAFCRTGDADVWLSVAGAVGTAGEQSEPGELVSPRLWQVRVEPSLNIRVLGVGEKKAPLYFGIGMGWHHFWGEDVSFNRGSVEARVGFIYPLQKVGLGVRYSRKVFFDGFTAADFGDPVGTFTTDGNDAVHSLFVHVTLFSF